MNKRWSFYDALTGAVHRQSYEGPLDGLAINTPAGHNALLGAIDHESQRVNLSTLQVEDAIPPAPEPAEDFEWNAERRRWTMTATAAQKTGNLARVQASIEALERKKLRPLGELAVDVTNRDARNTLVEIEDQLTTLRLERKSFERSKPV